MYCTTDVTFQKIMFRNVLATVNVVFTNIDLIQLQLVELFSLTFDFLLFCSRACPEQLFTDELAACDCGLELLVCGGYLLTGHADLALQVPQCTSGQSKWCQRASGLTWC